ncbi:MAG: endonuclease/exonuclease/phosphatase family protein [Planctomycetota bacterium]
MSRLASIVIAGSALLLPLSTACAQLTDPVYRGGIREAKPKADGAVRIATYNIENLFDDRDDPALEGRYDDQWAYEKTFRPKPQRHQKAAADAIRKLDADILGLQEIESYDALIEFRETYLKDMGYDYVISIDVGQERGIEQAVLSRYPIRQASVWPNMPLEGAHPEDSRDAGEPLAYRRSPLMVDVEIPGEQPYELTIFVIHHKSGSRNAYWREAEADALLGKIATMRRSDPQRNIAVMGDFNATVQDEAVQKYVSSGLIDTLGERKKGDEAVITHSSARSIDFVFVTPSLNAEVIQGSGFVLGATPWRARDIDWRNTPAPPGYASDHHPVAVDLVPRDK